MSMSKQTPTTCAECNGTGKLTRLGGDWGKTPDTEVPCWRCQSTLPKCHYCSGNMDDLSYSPYCGPQCVIDAERDN